MARNKGDLAPERVAKLYQDLPYLEAYRRHTDLRVADDAREAVGGQWETLGGLQFKYLVANGLTPASKMLDVGCGTLRGGRHFIRFLNPGGYTGIDISGAAIASGEQLIESEGLKGRRPRLIWNPQPEDWFPPAIGDRFDFLLAQSVFTHLDAPHIEACFARLHTVMAADARFFFTYNEDGKSTRRGIKGFGHPFVLFETLAQRQGFVVERRADYAHPGGQIMAVLR